MRRLLLIPLILFLLLAGALLWSGSALRQPADFTFVNRGDVGTLDPNRMSWLQDIRVGYALWEGLYTLDSKTLKPIPGSADRVTISPDKTRYTFHIRPEARWSDGTPLVAGDFVFAWRRMLEEPGDYTELFDCIRGATAYRNAFAAGEPADFRTVGIAAPDPSTLSVQLTHPVAYFLDLCAFPPFFPLNARSMAPFKQVDPTTGHVSYDKAFTRPPHLVGNGPYRLNLWQFKRRIRLEASPYYWDRSHIHSKVIDILTTDDPMWGYLKYDSGAVDWIPDASGPIAAELYARKRPDLHVFPAFGTYFYSLNCDPTLPDGRPNPLADPRVRRALSLAIDRRAIVQTITRLGERPAANYIPPGIFPDYPSPHATARDPDAARRLLAEAGYPDGHGFPSISILFNTEFHHAQVAQMIRRQWLQQLGIDVKLEGLEVKIFRQRLHHHDFTVARASWFGDYNDPSTFTDKYLSTSGNNDSDWKNPEYDRLCAAAAVETDNTKRMQLLSQAEALLLQQQPIIPLYYYVNCTLFRPKVHGISLNPRNMTLLKWVGKEE